MEMHHDQLLVTVATVRALIRQQFPRWAGLPVREVVSSGTVNAMFRLGDALVARFRLQPADPDRTRRELVAETAAAQELLGRTGFATPEVIAVGEPGPGYPMPWSVQTWLTGTTAADTDPGGSTRFAEDLVALISDLRAVDTRGRIFPGIGRGGDLRNHDAWMETCFARSGRLLDVDHLRQMWAALRELPATGPDVMNHGDLIPANVLVDDDRLVGVIDVGGFGPADPALDLVGAWHLLEREPRQVLRDGLGCSDLEWARGRAWAFEQAMGLVWYYTESNPVMSRLGRRTLARLVADG